MIFTMIMNLPPPPPPTPPRRPVELQSRTYSCTSNSEVVDLRLQSLRTEKPLLICVDLHDCTDHNSAKTLFLHVFQSGETANRRCHGLVITSFSNQSRRLFQEVIPRGLAASHQRNIMQKKKSRYTCLTKVVLPCTIVCCVL